MIDQGYLHSDVMAENDGEGNNISFLGLKVDDDIKRQKYQQESIINDPTFFSFLFFSL